MWKRGEGMAGMWVWSQPKSCLFIQSDLILCMLLIIHLVIYVISLSTFCVIAHHYLDTYHSYYVLISGPWKLSSLLFLQPIIQFVCLRLKFENELSPCIIGFKQFPDSKPLRFWQLQTYSSESLKHPKEPREGISSSRDKVLNSTPFPLIHSECLLPFRTGGSFWPCVWALSGVNFWLQINSTPLMIH